LETEIFLIRGKLKKKKKNKTAVQRFFWFSGTVKGGGRGFSEESVKVDVSM
jgi:hypothetical protein